MHLTAAWKLAWGTQEHAKANLQTTEGKVALFGWGIDVGHQWKFTQPSSNGEGGSTLCSLIFVPYFILGSYLLLLVLWAGLFSLGSVVRRFLQHVAFIQPSPDEVTAVTSHHCLSWCVECHIIWGEKRNPKRNLKKPTLPDFFCWTAQFSA